MSLLYVLLLTNEIYEQLTIPGVIKWYLIWLIYIPVSGHPSATLHRLSVNIAISRHQHLICVLLRRNLPGGIRTGLCSLCCRSRWRCTRMVNLWHMPLSMLQTLTRWAGLMCLGWWVPVGMMFLHLLMTTMLLPQWKEFLGKICFGLIIVINLWFFALLRHFYTVSCGHQRWQTCSICLCKMINLIIAYW